MSFPKTNQEFISAVCRIDNETDARAFAEEFLEFLISHMRESDDVIEKAKAHLRADIGWCFGEGMTQEQIDIWVKVCGASHICFGQKLPATFEEALVLGFKFASGGNRKDQ